MVAVANSSSRNDRRSSRQLLCSAVLFLLLVAIAACLGGPKRRPAGFLNLGLVEELARSDQTFFSDLKILLRRDERGFYAMSTACTYDLSPLLFSERDGQLLWRSQLSPSSYAPDGSVVHGPATAPLPYYKLQVAPGTIGGPADTLFVEVGIDRPASWRLAVPQPSKP